MRSLKKIIYIFIIFILNFGICNALSYTMNENDENHIAMGDFVIGTHLFTEEFTLSASNFTDQVILYGASSIDASKLSDVSMLYSLGDMMYDSLTDNVIEYEEGHTFNITHVNGVCVDSSCMGDAIKIIFTANDLPSSVVTSKTINVGYGERISSSDLPQVNNRPGYKFVCWTLAGEDECFDFTSPITTDLIPEGAEGVTFETSWEQILYTVTYNDNFSNKSEYPSFECQQGSPGQPCVMKEYSTLGLENKSNYIFKGWSTTTDGKIVYPEETNFEFMLGDESNITLYAIWEPVKYDITYNLDGGAFTDVNIRTTYTMEDGKLVLPTSLVKPGYTFKQWNYEGNKYNDQLVANGMTLTAEWTPNTYTFKYSESQSVTCTYDNDDCKVDFEPAAETIPAGKEFTRWYIEDNGNKVYIDTTGRLNNFTIENGKSYVLKPEYSLITYSINYVYNDGIVNKDNVTSFTYDSENTANNKNVTLVAPSKDGYTFVGWNVTNGSANVSGNTLTVTGVGNVTLNAVFNENKYNIVYKNNNEVYKTQEDVLYTQLKTIDEELTDSVNDFDGWITKNGLVFGKDTSLVAVDTYADGNVITLNAKWTNKDKYSVSYDLDGGLFANSGGVSAQASYLRGEKVTLPEVSKVGYEFAGWTLNGENVGNIKEVTGRTENLELKANWIANKYTIEFYKNDGTKLFKKDGTGVESVKCDYDVECPFGNHNDLDFGDENIELTGWATETNGQIFYGDNITVKNLTAENGKVIALYAVSEDRNIYYNVTADLGVGVPVDGQELTTGIVKENTEITLPEFVENSEYTFDGWYVNNVRVEDTTIIITENSHIEARWSKIIVNEFNKYSVSFVRDGNVLGKVNVNTYDNFLSRNEAGEVIPNYNYTIAYQVLGFEYQVADDYVMNYDNSNLELHHYRYTLSDSDGLISIIIVNTYDEILVLDSDNHLQLNENYDIVEQVNGFTIKVEEISEDGNSVLNMMIFQSFENDTLG